MVRVYLNSNYSNCPTLHADTILRFLPEKMWTYWWQCHLDLQVFIIGPYRKVGSLNQKGSQSLHTLQILICF